MPLYDCTETVWGCAYVILRRSRGWQTSWRTPVCAWKMRWTSTGKWWTNWNRTDSSFRRRKKPCRRWEDYCAIRRTHTQSGLFLSFSLSLRSSQHVHLQNTASTLYNTVHLSFLLYLADRGPASRAGAFAAVQAGSREAWSGPQLFLKPFRFQQQDQGGGARARDQEAQAGTDERLSLNASLCMVSSASIVASGF